MSYVSVLPDDLILTTDDEDLTPAEIRRKRVLWQVKDIHKLLTNRGRNDKISKFRDEFVIVLLKHFAEGKRYASLAPKLGVRLKTMYAWEKKYPLWAEAKAIGQGMSLEHHEDVLNALALGHVKGNAAAAIFNAKNVHPEEYKDKREMDLKGGGVATVIIETGIPAKKRIIEEEEEEFIEAEIVQPRQIEYEEEDDDSDLL